MAQPGLAVESFSNGMQSQIIPVVASSEKSD